MSLPTTAKSVPKIKYTIAQIDALIETCTDLGKDLTNWDEIVENKKVIDKFLDERLALMKKEGKK